MTHEGKKRDELQKEIISELLTASEFYLAAAENTKGEEWKAVSFPAQILTLLPLPLWKPFCFHSLHL